MQLSNREIIDLTNKRFGELLVTLKNINEGVFYSRKDIKNVMIDRFDEAYAELKARFLKKNDKNLSKGEEKNG